MRLSFLSTASTAALLSSLFSFPAFAQQLPPLPVQVNANVLENLGMPGTRRRGNCSTDLPLTAIAYSPQADSEETGGMITNQAQPTLWFYLPPLQDRTVSSFTLQDSRGVQAYEGQLLGKTNGDGIISVPVAVSLLEGVPYHWFLTLGCGENEQTTVDGWIERRPGNPELSRVFSQASLRNQAALYANGGFLQDALSQLALLRLANPANEAIASDWTGFLSDLGLVDLTAAPMLECCQLAEASAIPEEVEEVEEIEQTEPEVLDSEQIESEQAEPTEESQTGPELDERPADTRTILQRARDRR